MALVAIAEVVAVVGVVVVVVAVVVAVAVAAVAVAVAVVLVVLVVAVVVTTGTVVKHIVCAIRGWECGDDTRVWGVQGLHVWECGVCRACTSLSVSISDLASSFTQNSCIRGRVSVRRRCRVLMANCSLGTRLGL